MEHEQEANGTKLKIRPKMAIRMHERRKSLTFNMQRRNWWWKSYFHFRNPIRSRSIFGVHKIWNGIKRSVHRRSVKQCIRNIGTVCTRPDRSRDSVRPFIVLGLAALSGGGGEKMLHSDLKDIRLCLCHTHVVAPRQLIVGGEINHPAVFSMCTNVALRDYRAAYEIERRAQSPDPRPGGRWQWLQSVLVRAAQPADSARAKRNGGN